MTFADLLRSTRRRIDDEALERRLERWEDAGVISADQHAAISVLEFKREIDADRAGPSLGAEVTIYLGSIMALVGAAVIVRRAWDGLLFAGRFGIALALAAVGFGVGSALVRVTTPTTQRLASFLWTIGTGGLALAAISVLDLTGFDEGGWNAVIVGTPVLTVGVVLWRNRERPLQLLTAVTGVALVGGGAGAVVEVAGWIAGSIVWAAAAVLGGLVLTGRVRPATTALAVAGFAMQVGASMFIDLNEHVGLMAQTATAVLVVLVGVATRRTPILVIGSLGLLVGVQALLIRTFGTALGAITVAGGGMVLIALAVLHSMRVAGDAS